MFIDEDLLGRQEDLELFNNIGCLDALEGRLTVWLTINQTPRLRWEFETARGDYTYESLSSDPPKKLTSWDGSVPCLIVKDPKFTYRGGRRRQSKGYAEQVSYGDISADAHYCDFYLPNADFMRKAVDANLSREGITTYDISAIARRLNIESFSAKLDDDWSVELSTNPESINWLKPEKQNKGSMITLRLRLYQPKQFSTSFHNLAVKSLVDAKQLISDLCLTLSYANGGYIKPVYVLAKRFVEYDSNPADTGIEDVAALAEAPLVAPQEEIGQGFLRVLGIRDLLDFVQCFPSFQRMLRTSHWRAKWLVILEWYFQAILRPSGRRRNAQLPVVANALGTLLENLARLIMVDEEPDSTQRRINEDLSARQRIKALLKRIGIADTDDEKVDQFIIIRNNSTHAQTKPIALNEMEQLEVIQQAVQWVDEVILWRLGYSGLYRERSLYSNKGIQPRYDLSSGRDPNW